MHTGPYSSELARLNGTFLGRGVIGHVVMNQMMNQKRFGLGNDARKKDNLVQNIGCSPAQYWVRCGYGVVLPGLGVGRYVDRI